MCGIVGYIGDRQASPILIKGLKKLEYRGYDSAGIAIYDDKINVVKAKGRLSNLEEKLEQMGDLKGKMGIGHTRWATHGEPSDANSHPHTSGDNIAIVHNGIIENYMKLKEFLVEKGYTFQSETDTEVVAHLYDYCYTGDMVDTLIKVAAQIHGSYALLFMKSGEDGQIVAIRKDSPLIVGLGVGENFLASDIPAILEETRDYYLLNDNEIVVLKKDKITILDMDKKEVKKDIFNVTWDVASAQKDGYPHFMLKEIMEQPTALKNTLHPRIENGVVDFGDVVLDDEFIRNIGKINIIACGSAWHVGMVAKYTIEKIARINVEVDLASEFRYRDPILNKNDLCIVISQSGETADTLAALREAKKNGVKILSIVNVVGSSIARESDHVIYTYAGPEIAVATTKAYSTQLSLTYLLAIYFAKAKGLLSDSKITDLIKEIEKIPDQVAHVLKLEPMLKEIAKDYKDAKDVFFIGRGVDYGVSLEGSLKLKEISYIHSEAYAAGELKHGTISLIEPGTVVVALATQDNLFQKLVSNIKEVKARGAHVMALAKEGNVDIEEVADEVIYIPSCADLFAPSLAVVPLQILAYYISVERGCDVDKPRNLAKSVTVE